MIIDPYRFGRVVLGRTKVWRSTGGLQGGYYRIVFKSEGPDDLNAFAGSPNNVTVPSGVTGARINAQIFYDGVNGQPAGLRHSHVQVGGNDTWGTGTIVGTANVSAGTSGADYPVTIPQFTTAVTAGQELRLRGQALDGTATWRFLGGENNTFLDIEWLS